MFNRHNKTLRCQYSLGILFCLACSLGVSAADAKVDGALHKTQPAKVYPLATSSLMLDVVKTGDALVAVGERGHILRSEDGQSWTQVAAPIDSLLTAVSFADARHGWAVGHDAAILHTADGGQSWVVQHFDAEGSGPLLDVEFESKDVGYAVGAFGSFFSTTDGGKTWQPHHAPAVVDAGVHLYSLNRFDTGRWVVVGEMGFVAATNDEGDWEVLASPYDGSFYSVAQKGERGALVVGMRGNAYLTDDLFSGEWQKIETNTLMGLTSVTRLPSGRYAITGINRTLLLLFPNGQVSRALVEGQESISNTGSYNAVAVQGPQVYVASDEGVMLAKRPK